MRVGYLTYGLDRAPMGIGRYAIELVRALQALPDHPEIVLLTTERTDLHGLWQAFEHHALPGCRLLPALFTIGNVTISRAIGRYHLDLVHDPNGIAPFLGPDSGVQRVVTIYDAVPYLYPETHNKLDNWRYRWMLPQAVRRSDMILTVSQHSQMDLTRLLKIPAAKLRVIAPGVTPNFRRVVDQQRNAAVLARYGIVPPYVLYVGGLNPRKNIVRVLEAFAEVHRTHPDVSLVVGGKRQWQAAQIGTAVERVELDGIVHFTGYIDDADLPALYSAAELFVFPSLYEGFGMPPLEAMACGTPVVTSSVASLPEVVGDAALAVDPYDVPALARAIERLLDDPSLRADLSRRGLERAAQFTWQRAARATLDVYTDLVRRAQDGTIGTLAGRIGETY